MPRFGAKNPITTTWRLAKMNLAIRRIEANLGEGHGDTLSNRQFP